MNCHGFAMNRHTSLRHALAVALLLISLHAASAEEREGARRGTPLPTYTKECSDCHIPFPAGMLPAESWRRVLGDLSHHYGVDASLDAATVNELNAWLVANAGTYKRVREVPPEDRITRSAWFVREHREISSATWKRPAIKQAANCGACHPRAENGDFNEDDVRIPR